MRKAFHLKVLRTEMVEELTLLGYLRSLNAKSTQRIMKTARETTWVTRPAIMMLTPVCLVLGLLSAVAVMPPPPPWRTRERKSQEMKTRVYVLGLIREAPSPYMTTMRARQR